MADFCFNYFLFPVVQRFVYTAGKAKYGLS